jgi:IS30 family transposase
MPRLTEEKREEIRELQEKGIRDATISRMLGIPYSTVHYQRPDVKERKREYYKRPDVKERKREYYKRPDVKERKREYRRDVQFEEFMDLVRRVETENNLEGLSLSKYNLYVSILECLNDTKYGKKYKQIVNEMNAEGRKILPKLKKLRKEDLINYYDKRYSLSDKGKRLCKYLFSEVLLV